MGSIGSSQPAISTLKELRKEYPELIKTSGATYHIEGMGWYKQRTTPFGTETYYKDWNDDWTRTNFDDLVKYVRQIHPKKGAKK